MEKNYVLYEIEIINDIPMWIWKTNIFARNIVDAEHKAEPHIESGKEYIIILTK